MRSHIDPSKVWDVSIYRSVVEGGRRRELGLIRHASLAFMLVGDDGLGHADKKGRQDRRVFIDSNSPSLQSCGRVPQSIPYGVSRRALARSLTPPSTAAWAYYVAFQGVDTKPYDLKVQRRGGKTWKIRVRPYLDAISLASDSDVSLSVVLSLTI